MILHWESVSSCSNLYIHSENQALKPRSALNFEKFANQKSHKAGVRNSVYSEDFSLRSFLGVNMPREPVKPLTNEKFVN